MHHYSLLDSSNVVQRVVHLDDSEIDSVEAGLEFVRSNYGGGDAWIHTTHEESGESSFCPAVGFIYYPDSQTFRYAQPYPSWTWGPVTIKSQDPEWVDEVRYSWNPPVAFPDSDLADDVIDGVAAGTTYEWDEALYQRDNTKGWVACPPSQDHNGDLNIPDKSEAVEKLKSLGLSVADLKAILGLE